MKKIILLTFIMLLITVNIKSQITLVKDIVTTDGDANVYNFLEGNNFTIFLYSAANGQQVWATDGTEAGTVNIGANITDVFNVFQSSIIFNNELYFVIEDGNTGAELYKTDGTLAGTSIVKDINPNFGSNPENFTILNNELFFTADDGNNGLQLWKTDGTNAGTTLVSTNVSSPQNLTIFNGNIYFQGSDNNFDAELWKTDGTDAGTVLVKNIEAGNSSSSPRNFTVFNGELFFTAFTGALGEELWKTDGTEAGTVMIKDINPDNSIENGRGLFDGMFLVNNKIIFEAFDADNNRELWTTDGTAAGTTLLKDINQGKGWGTYSEESAIVNNLLFFNGNNGNNGFELYKSDGTAAGTVMLKNLNNAPNGSNPSDFGVALNKLYIKADSTNFGNSRLFATDGTTADWVIDNTNGPIVGPKAITEYQGKAYLTSSDFGEDYGIFYTDLQDAKEFVKKINPGGFANINSFFHYQNTNELIFSADDGTNGKELWKSDGTASGTVLVKDLVVGAVGSFPTDFFEFDNTLYFVTTEEFGGFPRNYKKSLWKSDGTTAGTTLLKEFSFIGTNLPPYFTIYKNKLYFTVFDNSTGDFHLWRTDGTIAGTEAAYVGFTFPKNMIVIGDDMFLAATTGADGQEMWKYDGTDAELFMSFSNGGNSGYFPFEQFRTLVNGIYYFSSFDNGTNSIWKTDGTLAGTEKILDSYAFMKELVKAGDIFYFSMDDNVNGVELWKSDGTAAGTSMVQDLFPGEDAFGGKNSSNPSNLTILGNDLYFSATSPDFGTELFKVENAVLNVEKESISKLDLKMNVFPNPSNSQVTISALNNSTINKVEVFNLLGKRILTKNAENKSSTTLNVSRLSTGIYIVKANINNKVVSRKLIVN